MGVSKLALATVGLIVVGQIVTSAATTYFQNGTQQGMVSLVGVILGAAYFVYLGFFKLQKSSDN